jgi:hypothetical protein
MVNQKAFTIITLLIVVAIIGLSALLGLRFYSGSRQEREEGELLQDKAKNMIVQANADVVHSLIQGALSNPDISFEEILNLCQNAGLRDPFSKVSMNSPKWFPEIANSPGEIQVTLEAEIFYIQGYGSEGLLANQLKVKK